MQCLAQPKYTVTDLGTLSGGFHSEATGINAAGQVVGFSPSSSGFVHAFRTAPGAPINPATDDLGTLGGAMSQATGINNAGQVGGVSITGTGNFHAFRTAPNTAINAATDDLGTLGGDTSWAYGINAAGEVVGYSNPTADQIHAFRTAPDTAINPATDDLGGLVIVPVGTQAVAYGINAGDQVVGTSYAGRGTHAFRTSHNAAINPATDDLGTLGGAGSTAFGINAAGQVVGYSDIALTFFGYHAFRTAPGAPINPATDDLGTLGGSLSIAFGINASSQVVGSAQIATGESHAFVHSDGVMRDLNGLIPAGSGWVLQEATSINDKGQIVGNGFHNGSPRAFRLDP
jgi:probable HAF family extracellular repeat protein